MRYLLLIALFVAVIITAGCIQDNGKTVVNPIQLPTSTIIPQATTIPQITVVSTPSQTYKNADIYFGVNPTFGFTMDYPSEWGYAKEDNRMWYLSDEYNGGQCGVRKGYIFSSPDKNSQVFVMSARRGLASSSLADLDVWADRCVKVMNLSYCHDGAGNRMSCPPNEKFYYHMNLISNDIVNLSGNVAARKLVFKSYDDRYAGVDTFYLFYDRKTPGDNRAYAIFLYTAKDQVNATSDIFNHMINSFQITSTEFS